MPLFLDTRGRQTLGIGICARCSRKMSLDDLRPDGNSPGLMVCEDDWDPLNPWRLPPRPPDNFTLQNPRPDTPLYPFTPLHIYADQVDGIETVQRAVVWSPGRGYRRGASITPENVNDPTVDLPQYWFIALNDGTSGEFTPEWPSQAGVPVTDGTVRWMCAGIFLLDGDEPALPASKILENPVPALELEYPPAIGFDLINDNGVLTLLDPEAWPPFNLPGAGFSNGGVASIVPGYTPIASGPILFGRINAAQLLTRTRELPVIEPDGELQLWNNHGEINVTPGFFLNNAGFLCVRDNQGVFPTDPTGLPPASIWVDATFVKITAGPAPGPAPALYFDSLTPTALIEGAGDLPVVNPAAGSGEIWNNAGFVGIA